MSEGQPRAQSNFQARFADIVSDQHEPVPVNTGPSIYYISEDKPGVRWDGAPIRIITALEEHSEQHTSAMYLDAPLFTQSEELIQSAGNRLVNCDDCSPIFLVNLADRLADGSMAYPEVIRKAVVRGIREVFLSQASPRDFYDRLSEHATLVFKDDAEPAMYRVTGELFFESMSNKKILAFDVHDLLHHPLQLAVWPEQFQAISGAAATAKRLPEGHQHAKRLQKLTELMWLATFEESLINLDGELVSFGCLNWLAPAETPYDRVSDIRELSVRDQKIAYRWHYLDALKDMYRIQSASSLELGGNVNWLERLGYAVDEKFTSLITSSDPRPLENLAFDDALTFDVKAPLSPEELFENALLLIEEEFDDAQR